MTPAIFWIGSPKFSPGHPAPIIALVHHRMVGTLRSTDAAFTSTDGREASTNFGVGYDCGIAGHPQGLAGAHVHQYVALGDQAWGNGNWDASGQWNDRYPTTYVNSRTVSIEHHDNGGRTLGNGKGVVPEEVIRASVELDRLLLTGEVAALKAAGIHFRSGTEAAIGRELAAIPLDALHLIDHHFISGRLKPYCWRPWADDRVGFPQARYLAALAAPEENMGIPIRLDATAQTDPAKILACFGTAHIVGKNHDLFGVAEAQALVRDVPDGHPLGIVQTGTVVEATGPFAAGERCVVYNLTVGGRTVQALSPWRDIGSSFVPLKLPAPDCTAAVKAATDSLTKRLATANGRIRDAAIRLGATPGADI